MKFFTYVVSTYLLVCSGAYAEICKSIDVRPGFIPNYRCLSDKGSIESVKWLLDRIEEIEAIDGKVSKNESMQSTKLGLKGVKSYAEERSKFTGKFSFGYEGESTVNDETEESGLQLDVEVTRDAYPSQTRLAVNFEVDSDSDGFEEIIGTALVNHDYYFHPNFEGFTFVERFQNDEMSINERWEIGVGIKYERNHEKAFRFKKLSRTSIEGLFKENNLPFNKKYAKSDKYFEPNLSVADALTDEYVRKSEVEKRQAHMKRHCSGDYIENDVCEWKKQFNHHMSSTVSLLADKDFRQGLNRRTSALEWGISAAIFQEYLVDPDKPQVFTHKSAEPASPGL